MMVFPTDPLEYMFEIALGADITGDPALWSWTDISAYVSTADGAKVVVRRGRRNDSGSVPPATASFKLDNRDGRFCTQNPMSPYFPNLAVNTPVKISVSTDSGSSWSVRFSGFLSKLPTTWGGSAASESWVSVTADSILRRLEEEPSRTPLQGTAPNLVAGRCIEYWPLEDQKGATQAASYFADGVPMTVIGSIEMGASSPPPGSAATAQSDYAFQLANRPSLTGIVRPYTDTHEWTVLGIFKVDPDSLVNQVLMICDINVDDTNTHPDQLRLTLNEDAWALHAYAEDTALGSYTTSAQVVAPNDGGWHAFALVAAQAGADIQFSLRYEGNTYSFTLVGKTLGTVRKIAYPSTTLTVDAELLAVGHLAVYDDALIPGFINEYGNAMNAHATVGGERVDLRLSRLASESDLIHSIGTTAGDLDMWEQAGAQPDGNALNAVQDAAEADGGLLYEPRDFADGSLYYLSRSTLNENMIGTPALTLTQDDFSIIEQGDDDHYLATKVTVTGAGSSATAVREPAQNETTQSRNIRFPDRLPDLAGWALFQGTRRDYRYPRIQILLHGATGQIAAWKLTELGDRVLITDPPPGVVDDIDLLLEGYQETMDQFSWTVELYCSPASRYRIAELDDTDLGRMDTAGSRLINAVSSSATSLDVETTEGPEWTTTAGFDIGVGGERMTVSAISGAFTDSFTRSTSNGWGTSTSGHAWSTTGGVAADYSVNGTRGIMALGVVGSLRGTYISALPVANIDRTLTFRIPVLATGAGIQVRSTARWDVAANTYYAAMIRAETTAAVTLQILKVVAGATTTIKTKTVVGLTHTATTDYRLRFKVDGSWLYAKVWVGTEPTQWSEVAWDTEITAAGAWGYRGVLNGGNTNALPVNLQFDADATLHPQTFTVTRSVNAVTKTHSAESAVGLFQPNHVGL